MFSLPNLQTYPRLPLSFIWVFVTSLSTSINVKINALEVRHHPFVGTGRIDEEASYTFQSLVGHNIPPHQCIHIWDKTPGFPQFNLVTVITTSFIEVCATVTAHGPGVREGSFRFLDAYWIPSELQIEQKLFSACQHTSSECSMMQP